MNSRGQALMIELIGALFVFLLVFLFLQNLWPQNITRWNTEVEYRTMYNRAVSQASNLVESQGYPTNWTSDDVNIVGLAKKKNVLDQNKIEEYAKLETSDYNLSKHQMKFFEYDFWVEIDSENNALDKNIGKKPPQDSKIVSIQRIVALEGKNAVFRLSVFR